MLAISRRSLPCVPMLLGYLFFITLTSVDGGSWSAEEETSEYWNDVGRSTLSDILQRKLIEHPAKNIILFLGDGMSLGTMTAGRILKGQKEGQAGEETVNIFDKFESVGLSKVYSVDKQTPDSASTATAILSGVKTKFLTLGINGKGRLDHCPSVKGNEVESILKSSSSEGKSTGIVTTTQLQHASPAAAYAHAANRKWLSDADMKWSQKHQEGCKDIARQLYENRMNINVALGGGRAYMKPSNTYDEEYGTPGNRGDGRNLIKEWINNMPSQTSRYVWNQKGFDAVDPLETDYLLGMFQPEAMKFEHERKLDSAGEPSISEMTKKAIQVLQKNKKGYFLFVEGGKIDHAHHQTRANIALNEFLAFEKAVETAVQMTSLNDTLIIVTADHGHGFTLGGYGERGNPVNGLARSNANPENARDNKKYSTITYANGAAYQGVPVWKAGRVSPSYSMTKNIKYQFQSAVPLSSETHSGEDVMILARGPMSQLFSGTFEQNYIAHAMRYASCVGTNKSLCEKKMLESTENSKTKATLPPVEPSVVPTKCSVVEEDNSSKTELKQFLKNVDDKVGEILEKMEALRSI